MDYSKIRIQYYEFILYLNVRSKIGFLIWLKIG